MAKKQKSRSRRPLFIDLFSGCGGLSLGMINAGWRGVFAVEKDKMAFETLRVNLIDGGVKGFAWPRWLKKEAMQISGVIRKHRTQLLKLRGKVELIVGGPPCQGFSTAGRRDKNDPRNTLTSQYLRIVSLVQPRFILIENVRGFDIAFEEGKKEKGSKQKKISYAEQVAKKLHRKGYNVYSQMICTSDYGVPQKRLRFILIAIKKDDPSLAQLGDETPFDVLTRSREVFLSKKGLSTNRKITVSEAISDLKTSGKRLIPATDCSMGGFFQIQYAQPKKMHPYKRMLRKGLRKGASPKDLRIPNHKEETVKFFKEVVRKCKRGRMLSPSDREKLGIKKQALTPLDGNRTSATITTLPDDILHYCEPRILTVRENARIQSFPDWFSFQGKYTTGGKQRKQECPRYTQVGNAVPPLLGEALGSVIEEFV